MRLDLIHRLQDRGYSLAAIRDLLESWRAGSDLNEVLGLTADELVQVEEPGVAVSADQLARALPTLVPQHLDALVATGVVEPCGPDRFCLPSPSLLHLAKDATAIGYPVGAVLTLLTQIARAAGLVADAALEAVAVPPAQADADELVKFATRARGLLAHGLGRMTIHSVGKRIGIGDEAETTAGLRRLVDGRTR
jgi:hypothetical protein